MPAVKLAITSDLYMPVTHPDRLVGLARQMAHFAPDAVVVAGDLAESLTDLARCLKLLRSEITCPLWVLPGDHDFWARPPYDSHRLYQDLIPQTVTAAGCHYLEGASFVINGVAVAGTVAWYDYSSAGTAGIVSDLEFAQKKYMHNADALRIDWEWSDPEFAGLVSSALLATLDTLDQDPAVRSIIVVTHFPILEQQLDRDRLLGFASAYAGNLTLGKKILHRPKVSHILSGHAHAARECLVAREGLPPIEVRVLPGDYEKPAWLGLTLSA
jgi:3',5'-cyclic AMP phosphodiesterase CpdA